LVIEFPCSILIYYFISIAYKKYYIKQNGYKYFFKEIEMDTILFIIVVLAVVIGFAVWRKSKSVESNVAEVETPAPYKVETPVVVNPEPVVASAATPVVEAKPELKVVQGAKKPRKSRPRKKSVAVAQTTDKVAAKPARAPRTPRAKPTSTT
jgi:hypothetical protein